MSKTKDDGKVTVTIQMGNEKDDRRVFIGGCSDGDKWIERGKPVRVSQEVIDRLKMAVELVPFLPNPDKPAEVEYIERPRFAFSVEP